CLPSLHRFQSNHQPFDSTKLIATPAEGAHHYLEERRIVYDGAPCAMTRTLLRGQRCCEWITKLREKEPQISEERVLAVDHPAQDGRVSFRRQAVHNEAGAEQD